MGQKVIRQRILLVLQTLTRTAGLAMLSRLPERPRHRLVLALRYDPEGEGVAVVF